MASGTCSHPPLLRSSFHRLQSSGSEFFDMRDLVAKQRPISNTTYIQDDTDFDSDGELEDDEARYSYHSAGQRSQSTLSSFEIETPASAKKDAGVFNFSVNKLDVERPHSNLSQASSTQGPSGPHLFRGSEIAADHADHALDESFYLSILPLSPGFPITPGFPKSPGVISTSDVLTPNTVIRMPPMPAMLMEAPHFSIHRPLSTMTEALEQLDRNEVAEWDPRQVAHWMMKAGFEPAIVRKFEENDISGAVLATLKFEDLRELDVKSLGKRHELWNEIDLLRNGKPPTPPAPTVIDCDGSSSDERKHRRHERHAKPKLRRRRVKPGMDDVISPLESISFVGFEQLMPKPHKCAKGENCSRWRKQQKLIEAFKNEHPIIPSGCSFLVAGDPGNPLTTDSVRPFSDAAPSLVASSDALGPGTPGLQISESALARVKSRDVQDNVRQFLTFQHVEHAYRPYVEALHDRSQEEMFPRMQSPSSMAHQARQDPRRLPKLAIPTFDPDAPSHQTPQAPYAQTTFSPGPMERISPKSPRLRSASQNQMWSATSRRPRGPIPPPDRFGTPASMNSVPHMISRLSELPQPDRNTSQSVPPNMTYRPHHPIPRTPSRTSRKSSQVVVLPRLLETPVESPRAGTGSTPPKSTSVESHNRSQSNTSHQSLFHPLSSDNTSTDRDPHAPQHAGTMKKRKTKFLYHEWHEHHFTLTGSKLAMHKDAASASAMLLAKNGGGIGDGDGDGVLESIDMDDYAVACTTLQKRGLSSALKAMGMGTTKNDIGKFTFQLIPEAVEHGWRLKWAERVLVAGSGGVGGHGKAERKDGKTHHFSVRSRDERIDWMRELMLAKALRAKADGRAVLVNGNAI